MGGACLPVQIAYLLLLLLDQDLDWGFTLVGSDQLLLFLLFLAMLQIHEIKALVGGRALIIR